MKTRKEKRLFCCLFFAVFVFCCFSQRSIAAGQSDTITFSTFDELQRFCNDAAGFSVGSLLCEEADLVISENLEIPTGRTVTFRSFTVPEGITLTVMQGAVIMTYGFTVQGELINWGTVFQGDLSRDGEIQDREISALIPGHVENKGEMTLTDVYGKRNIRWLGSHFTMIETERYGKTPDEDSKEPELQTKTSPTPEPTQHPTPSEELRNQALKFFDKMEVILPRLAFFMVIALFGYLIKIAWDVKKQEKTSKRSSSSSEIPFRASSGKTDPRRQNSINKTRSRDDEDHFQRDRRKRISQLDDWLKCGLINRKEYEELKKRYKR